MKGWRKICPILALGLLFLAQQAFTQSNTNSADYLDDYVISGVKIRAGFVPQKTVFIQGEPLQTVFTVKNVSTTNFQMSFGGDYRRTGRHERFKITATNSTGESAEDPFKNYNGPGGGIVQEISLPPGEIFTRALNLMQFRVIDKPGTYTIDCRFVWDDHSWWQTNPTGPVSNTRFNVTIMARTPERIAAVIEELLTKAKQADNNTELQQIFQTITAFGKEAAVPYLALAAKNGSLEFRKNAIRALPCVPSEDSLSVALDTFEDPDPIIRSAAAGALGDFKKLRAVDALLQKLPVEKPPVAEAIIVALGTSQSERAFPVITNILAGSDLTHQKAAIDALGNYGDSNAVSVLRAHITSNFLPLRYQITHLLAERLRQPIEAAWLLPVLMQREQNSEWLDSLRLLRLYTGKEAVPTLLSCLDFDADWSGRNWWILNEVQACQNAPHFTYNYDPNSNGTSTQRQKNLAALEYLKKFTDSPSTR